MSTANFFNKNALSAVQILQDVSLDDFQFMLSNQVVEIAFDETMESSDEAQVTLELICNLLSRLYPTIGLTSLKSNSGKIDELTRLSKSINPDIEILTDSFLPTITVVVGKTKFDRDVPVIYLGSDNWVAKLSISEPLGSGITKNPIGAAAAACLGVANVFRHVFFKYLECGELDTHIELSLFNFSQQKNDNWNPNLASIEVPDTYLVGVGAIGNGVMWILSRISDLSGNFHFIDAETVDLSNLQRYILTDQSSVGTKKVELGNSRISSTGLSLHPHDVDWGHYLPTRQNFDLDTILVAVDKAETRRLIQGSLPRFIINSWTQTGDLGISRHKFDDDQACLTCLYFPKGNEKARDLIIAAAVGLPEKRMDVRKMLAMGTLLNEEFLDEIATANSISLDDIRQFEGKTLEVFYSEAICGGLLLQLNETALPSEPQAQVPMAFQSAMAGIRGSYGIRQKIPQVS